MLIEIVGWRATLVCGPFLALLVTPVRVIHWFEHLLFGDVWYPVRRVSCILAISVDSVGHVLAASVVFCAELS